MDLVFLCGKITNSNFVYLIQVYSDFFISSWIEFNDLCLFRSLSISSTLSNLMSHGCLLSPFSSVESVVILIPNLGNCLLLYNSLSQSG